VAEERGKYFRRNGSQLHHAGDGNDGQWLDVPCSRYKHRGHSNERSSDANGERGTASANDQHTAIEPDGDGRADGDIHGSRDGHSAAELSVAEEWDEHHGGDFQQLHHTSDGNDG
jgi:hypothetical protein